MIWTRKCMRHCVCVCAVKSIILNVNAIVFLFDKSNSLPVGVYIQEKAQFYANVIDDNYREKRAHTHILIHVQTKDLSSFSKA